MSDHVPVDVPGCNRQVEEEDEPVHGYHHQDSGETLSNHLWNDPLNTHTHTQSDQCCDRSIGMSQTDHLLTYFVEFGAAGSSVDVITFQIGQSDDLMLGGQSSQLIQFHYWRLIIYWVQQINTSATAR